MKQYIPLNKPYWGKREETALVRAVRTSIGTGDGPYTKKLVTLLSRMTHDATVIPVTSCTHGLELAIRAMVLTDRMNPGDEVILPSYTMSSTANAVLLVGGVPVFADIDAVNFNIDPSDIVKKISRRTKGIIVVHYAGMACPMDEIQKIARSHGLFLIEDAAHAIGATYKRRALGTLSDVGVYSFHGTKNVSCGEGGAVIVRDPTLIAAMEIFRANGTNRKAFLEGIVDKYSWVGVGTSFYLSDILASVLIEQIKQIKTINNKRTLIASKYIKAFKTYTHLFVLPQVPEHAEPNWHIFAIRFYDAQKRTEFMKRMRSSGIDVAYHYIPLHSSLMGKRIYEDNFVKKSKHAKNQIDLPITDKVSKTLVRLPIYPDLTNNQLQYIITTAGNILKTL